VFEVIEEGRGWGRLKRRPAEDKQVSEAASTVKGPVDYAGIVVVQIAGPAAGSPGPAGQSLPRGRTTTRDIKRSASKTNL